MALTPSLIRVAAGRLYANTTPPGASTPLNLTAGGVPPSGNEMGLTQGESLFTYEITYDEEVADQVLAPVAVFATMESIQLEFTLLEYAAVGLQDFFENALLTVDDAPAAGEPRTDLFTIGSLSPSGADVLLQSVLLVSSIPNTTPQRYTLVMLYQAYQSAPAAVRYTREGSSVMKCTFKAIADTARTDGDLCGQVVIERNPVGA